MKKNKGFKLDEPLRHNCHSRPVSRRDFLAQGFLSGAGVTVGGSLLGMSNNASAANFLSDPMIAKRTACGIPTSGAGKIPFICFDLAGGANISGSNVLVGGRGGQLDFLSTAGYSKLGLPGDMVPQVNNADATLTDFVNTDLGLAFHSDSAFLRGIQEKFAAANQANVNGAIIPARSDNDTGNNPHNPMYGIFHAGSNGGLVPLIGSRTSDSGGNSMSPASMINPAARPTKVDRPTDATGLVDIGDLTELLSQGDAVAVMESIQRLSDAKLNRLNALTNDPSFAASQDAVSCGYVQSAHLADQFGNPAALDPIIDTKITGSTATSTGPDYTPIFTTPELMGDREFQKTASVMKLVIDGHAGAGTISMGGYDYHTGDRSTGEQRDLRAGRCMGACLEYAARAGKPLMMYVFSDGSVASNGMTDDSVDGRGKGVWTGDNSSTGSAFFLVYNPGSRPQLMGDTPDKQAQHQQLGYMSPGASVDTGATAAANNVNLLVETVIMNYMALHGEQGQFGTKFMGHGLGNATQMDSLTAFQPIVNGVISNPA